MTLRKHIANKEEDAPSESPIENRAVSVSYRERTQAEIESAEE